MSRGGNYRFLHGKDPFAEASCRTVAKTLPSAQFSRPRVSSAAMMDVYVRLYLGYCGCGFRHIPMRSGNGRSSHLGLHVTHIHGCFWVRRSPVMSPNGGSGASYSPWNGTTDSPIHAHLAHPAFGSSYSFSGRFSE